MKICRTLSSNLVRVINDCKKWRGLLSNYSKFIYSNSRQSIKRLLSSRFSNDLLLLLSQSIATRLATLLLRNAIELNVRYQINKSSSISSKIVFREKQATYKSVVFFVKNFALQFLVKIVLTKDSKKSKNKKKYLKNPKIKKNYSKH